MINDYAVATIEGFLTHEPILKTTKTGKHVCTFALAIHHYSKKDEPQKVSFIDVESWETLADECNELKKGDRVIVIGSLRQDRWEDDKGKVASRIKIIVKEMRRLKNVNGC